LAEIGTFVWGKKGSRKEATSEVDFHSGEAHEGAYWLLVELGCRKNIKRKERRERKPDCK